MNVLVALFLGTLATVVLGGVARGRLEEIKGGFLAAGLWALFSWGMTNLEFVADDGTVVSDPHNSMAVVGLIMAAISVVVGIVGIAPFINVFESGPTETGSVDEFR